MTDFSDLVDGYQRFHTSEWRRERERWAGLAKEQKPRVMIIACSDSRVEPSQIFDTVPGEIFVVRNVAALVPPCESGDSGYHGVSAAIEFAVTQLKVEEIVVLGHGACGGCKAALAGTFAETAQGDEGRFIGDWVSLLDGARDKVKAAHDDPTSREALRAMEQEGVKTSITNLRTFPFVKAAEDAGKLKLQGAVFAIDDGSLVVLGDSGEFEAAKPRM